GMKARLFTQSAIACAGLWALTAASAQAQPDEPVQPPSGPYVGAEVGYNFSNNVGIIPYSPPNLRLTDSSGSAIFIGKVGYALDPHWRLELEGGFRPNYQSSPGATENWSMMWNAYYDIMPAARLHPFVGAGLGANFMHVSYNTPGSIITGDTTR